MFRAEAAEDLWSIQANAVTIQQAFAAFNAERASIDAQ